jgi:hypothetical protein
MKNIKACNILIIIIKENRINRKRIVKSTTEMNINEDNYIINKRLEYKDILREIKLSKRK